MQYCQGGGVSETHKASDMPLPGGDFQLFVTRLGYQGMIALGLFENPVNGLKEVNLQSARTLIDDLLMLQEKTRGNLEPDEQERLDKAAGELQKFYTKLAASEAAGGAEDESRGTGTD